MRLLKGRGGYSLIELLVGTGLLSLATIGVYTIAMFAFDWRKVNQEVKLLGIVMEEIDNSTLSKGSYENISLLELEKMGVEFNSALNLVNIKSTGDKKINFEYSNISTRVCINFSEKMLSISNNIDIVVNGQKIVNKINDALNLCNTSGVNDVTVVLNKSQGDYTINNVVASVNPVPTPPLDIVIPELPVPRVPPVVLGFVPSTANPTTYSISGVAPNFPSTIVEKREITVTPGVNNVIVNPPDWSPPAVVIPGASPAPADNIDQDPNPPAPPKEELDWLGNYNLQGKIVSYLCRVSCWALPMDNSTIGGVARFLNNFELRVGGTTVNPKMETITLSKYEELAKNGYIFYFSGVEQVGPSNWGQYRNTYIICKKPTGPKSSEYGGIIINCS